MQYVNTLIRSVQIIIHSFEVSGRQLCKRVIFIFVGLGELQQIPSLWFCDYSSVVLHFDDFPLLTFVGLHMVEASTSGVSG